jgi:hypothetical protein
MTTPPASRASAIALRLPRFFSLHLCSSSAGTEVQTKAASVIAIGWFHHALLPSSPRGKVRMKPTMRSRNSRQRARMAPAWITMVYMAQKETSCEQAMSAAGQAAEFSRMCISASAMRRCAVELTGRNSVRPSTIPNRTDSR